MDVKTVSQAVKRTDFVKPPKPPKTATLATNIITKPGQINTGNVIFTLFFTRSTSFPKGVKRRCQKKASEKEEEGGGGGGGLEELYKKK